MLLQLNIVGGQLVTGALLRTAAPVASQLSGCSKLQGSITILRERKRPCSWMHQPWRVRQILSGWVSCRGGKFPAAPVTGEQ